MREILQIGIGKSGCEIAYDFIETISKEHSINPDGSINKENNDLLQSANVSFEETKQGNYVPRALLIDLDPSGVDNILTQKYSSTFTSSNIFQGKSGCSNIFGKGMYTIGKEAIDRIMDKLRNQIEKCDYFQGIQYYHSLCGGTGSGLMSLLIGEFTSEYTNRILQSFSLYPSSNTPNNCLELYNTVLANNKLVQYTNSSVCFDMKSLQNISQQIYQPQNNGFKLVDNLITQTASTLSSSMRFPGLQNTSLKKQHTNLICFPRMHFLISSYGPLVRDNAGVNEMSSFINELHQPQNQMLTQGDDNLIISALLQMRGSISTYEVENQLSALRQRDKKTMIKFNPYIHSIGYCNKTSDPKNYFEGSLLVNSSGIVHTLKWIIDKFSKQFERKGYLHYYTREGMDEMEVDEAKYGMIDLLNEYDEYARPREGNYLEGVEEEEEE